MAGISEDVGIRCEDPIDEWVYWASLLIDYKPDATLWDLFRLMYYIKVGYPVPLDEEEDVGIA